MNTLKRQRQQRRRQNLGENIEMSDVRESDSTSPIVRSEEQNVSSFIGASASINVYEEAQNNIPTVTDWKSGEINFHDASL